MTRPPYLVAADDLIFRLEELHDVGFLSVNWDHDSKLHDFQSLIPAGLQWRDRGRITIVELMDLIWNVQEHLQPEQVVLSLKPWKIKSRRRALMNNIKRSKVWRPAEVVKHLPGY